MATRPRAASDVAPRRRAATKTEFASDAPGPEAPAKCALCPRLVDYRRENTRAHPDWYNGAVPSFGTTSAQLLIVGLAPGRHGANRTGRPFTGDYAGDLLYATLDKFGLASGQYGAHPEDGLRLIDTMITNAVRCAPPENKPTVDEIAMCRGYFAQRLTALPRLRIILALGRIAHDQVLTTLKLRRAAYPFRHGARHDLGDGRALYDSFHCSRYNTNTGRLTAEMFENVFRAIKQELSA